MDRYNEQRLREEVIYLHSLWHQGPPRPHPTTTLTLKPCTSTQFKKITKKKSKKKRVKNIENGLSNSNPPTDSGVEWPCLPTAVTPPVTDSGWPSTWPTLTIRPDSLPYLPTAEELARLGSNQAQNKAMKAVSDYLKCSMSIEGEDDSDDDDDSDEDVSDAEEGCGEYDFFVKLFAEDEGLKEYYKKNWNSGEFSCLVCCGVGKKGWKRYKDCVALVQHSIAIAKTKKRQAHRAYGLVVCEILGWDINRLPSVLLSEGDNLGESSDNPVNAEGNEDDGGKNDLSGLSNTTVSVNICSDEVSKPKECFSNENQQENGSTALQDNSLCEPRANRSLEDISNGIPETEKGNVEGCLTADD